MISRLKPQELINRYETEEKYGAINSECVWQDQNRHMVNFRLPTELITHPQYNFVIPFLPMRPKVTTLYINRDMQEPLGLAIDNILKADLVRELKEFGGCFNIRASRGSSKLSAHAWGLAIDINMTGNALGETPHMLLKFVGCFEEAGFFWGGRYRRPDGMHFSIAGFDKPATGGPYV